MSLVIDFQRAIVAATKCRVAIAGVPLAGKSTRAAHIGLTTDIAPRATDELTERDWSEASAEVALWMDEPGPWIIEGCTVPRAIRKWWKERALITDPGYETFKDRRDIVRPCDVLIWMGSPREELERGQDIMAKGCKTVFDEIEPAMRAMGVAIVRW